MIKVLHGEVGEPAEPGVLQALMSPAYKLGSLICQR